MPKLGALQPQYVQVIVADDYVSVTVPDSPAIHEIALPDSELAFQMPATVWFDGAASRYWQDGAYSRFWNDGAI